jgi:hypothetical protein
MIGDSDPKTTTVWTFKGFRPTTNPMIREMVVEREPAERGAINHVMALPPQAHDDPRDEQVFAGFLDAIREIAALRTLPRR